MKAVDDVRDNRAKDVGEKRQDKKHQKHQADDEVVSAHTHPHSGLFRHRDLGRALEFSGLSVGNRSQRQRHHLDRLDLDDRPQDLPDLRQPARARAGIGAYQYRLGRSTRKILRETFVQHPCFLVARKYAHKIPFCVKLNHNELMTYPTKYDQILFGTVDEAYEMGAAAIGFGLATTVLLAGRKELSSAPAPDDERALNPE